jgi:hypothetical protein
MGLQEQEIPHTDTLMTHMSVPASGTEAQRSGMLAAAWVDSRTRYHFVEE